MATGYSAKQENGSEIQGSLECQQQSLPFSTIVQTIVLPVVVKYDSSSPLDEQLVTPAFNPKEPLLIHSKHRVRRFRARCVKFQPESKTFIDCDCDAVIPETYPGWFAVFGNPSRQARDPIVPHYRRISQLAISACTRFLVAGDRPINALLVRQGEGEKIDFHPTDIYPGTVLHKGKLFSTLSRPAKVKKKFRKKGKEKVQEENQYLSTKDDHGYTLFIPCEMEGLFYVLETETAHLQIPVLRFADVIQRYRFPLLIKLVQGRIPPFSSFNGTLVLFSSEFISFAITFSISLHKEMIFEILDDSSLPFLLSAPEENESEEYKNALICHKSHGDSFLHNIRFQYITSDYTYVKDYMANLDFTSFSGEKRSSGGPDITCVRIEDLRLFPPSPVNMKVVGDGKVPHSMLSLTVKEIRRSVTFDRPKGIQFDTIPIEQRRESRTTVSSTDEERLGSDTNSSTRRPQSGSECSTLSSASQPSLQDIVISESEEKEEDLPPPPAELLQADSVEYEDVPESVPDESRNYYGIWTANTLKKGLKLSTEVDERDGAILPNKMDNKNEDENEGRPNHPEISVWEDENGYVTASELTVQLNQERNRRPASYVSINPMENDYDTLNGWNNRYNTDYNDNPSNSVEARDHVQPRDTILSSGSHYYTSLVDAPVERVDKPNPKYVNISSPETGANGEGRYENISHVSSSLDDQGAPPIQNGQGQSAITQELASRSRDESSGYMNLQAISLRDDIAATHKDRLLEKLKQQDLKKTTQEALVALNEDDFVSMFHADDRLDRLKELVPQISKGDVFKIGLCLKDF